MSSFGYSQELRRGVGGYASFAAGFSFISILTTVFQLFGLGYFLGGASFFWTWPIVFVGQLSVAFCFAELAARWPISGAIYQWSSRLGGVTFGWITGWIMLIGEILCLAAAAMALQAVLPSLWSGFQIIGGSRANAALTSSTGAQNAILLACILIVLTTTVNILGIRHMAKATSICVTIEIIGVVIAVIALMVLSKRGPAVVMHHTGWSGHGYFGAFLASSLMAAYVMVGFDSAGELSEETHAPRRTIPRTMIRAVVTAGFGGGLLILVGLMAARNLTDGNLSAGGLAWVVTDRLGDFFGRLLLCFVVVAIFACTLAVQTAGARMMYSMAREKALPFHTHLAKVSPRTGTPIVTSIVVAVLAIIGLLVNLHQYAIFLALSSLCIAMVYLAYLGVTLPMLFKRFRGESAPRGVDESGRPLFSLGRWGVLINIVAVVYGAGMTINLAWPRSSVYDLTGHTWWLQWSAPLFIAATLLVGIVYYAYKHNVHGRIELRHLPHTHQLSEAHAGGVVAEQRIAGAIAEAS